LIYIKMSRLASSSREFSEMVTGKDLHPYLIFEGLSLSLKDELASCLMPASLPPDSVIFHRGDVPTRFVLLQSGRVKICCESQDGQEQILSFFEDGDSFAEAALFMKGYPATARTITQCDLLYMPKKRFQDLLAENSELALRMILSLAVKQRKFLRVIEDLSLRDARGRLCHYLSRLLDDTGLPESRKVTLPVSQGVLAHLLGVTEETLSRTIRSLRKDEILAPLSKGSFEIFDVERLKEAYAI
jgi:CRP/FNR family transcriptional regulator, dissimilatory nitrate respiration regulator